MDDFDDVRAILRIIGKYGMDITTRMVNGLRDARFVEKDPVRVYAIAVLNEVAEVARLAAAQSLRLTLDERPNVEELRYITGEDLQNLSDYYIACGKTAKYVALRHPISTAYHGQCQWWKEYRLGQLAADELSKRPHSATLLEPDCDKPLANTILCL